MIFPVLFASHRETHFSFFAAKNVVEDNLLGSFDLFFYEYWAKSNLQYSCLYNNEFEKSLSRTIFTFQKRFGKIRLLKDERIFEDGFTRQFQKRVA